MNQESANFNEVVKQVSKLSVEDKLRLVNLLAQSVEGELAAGGTSPRKSLLGLCSDLGTAPSVDEIDEARREVSFLR